MSRIISEGRLRVDATRAIGKLRDHLLVDQHLYLCELARCAVAADAKQIRVTYDADDLTIAFDWDGVPATALSRLFDHLLVDAPSSGERQLQRLALGVNAALALRPKWVDVVHTTPERSLRVRFTPGLLSSSAPGAPASRPEVKELRSPPGVRTSGLEITLRRRIGWDLVRQAASDAPPREIALLIKATNDLDVALTINGRAPVRPAGGVILRIAIERHDMRRSWVELLTHEQGMTCDFLEQGIQLVATSWSPPEDLSLPVGQGPTIPARLVVDATALPTNASRSALRQDSVLMYEAIAAGREALRAALHALTRLATGIPVDDSKVAILDPSQSKAEDALGGIVANVAAALRAGHQLHPNLIALLDLPLLRSATGQAVAVRDCLDRRTVLVLRRPEPLPEAMAPWVKDVLWLRGRVVEQVLSGVEEISAERVLEEARLGEERRQRFFAHAPTRPRIVPQREHVVRGSIEHREGALEGLFGEVAVSVVDPAVGHPGSTVFIYYEGRLLDTVTLLASVLPLCVDAALEWPARLLPDYGWEGVFRGPSLDRAIEVATETAIGLVAELATRLPELGEDERAAAASVVRSAILSLAVEGSPSQPDSGSRKVAEPRYAPLRIAQVWPLADGSTARLELLKEYAARSRAVCHVRPQSDIEGRAPDLRPVVVASIEEAQFLSRVLDAVSVLYERAIGSAEPHLQSERDRKLRTALDRMAPSAAPTMEFQQGTARGLIRVASHGRVVVIHAGTELELEQGDADLPNAVIAIEDASVVPTPTWEAVHFAPAWDLAAVCLGLGEKIAAALAGDARAADEVRLTYPEDTSGAKIYLLELLGWIQREQRKAKHRPGAGRTHAPPPSVLVSLATRIAELPLLDELDEEGRPTAVSLTHVRGRPRQRIPVLDQSPGFETLTWYPVIADQRTFKALRACASAFVPAASQLDGRRRQAERERKRRAVMESPRLPLDELPSQGDRSAATVSHRSEGPPQIALIVGLPQAPLAPSDPACEVLLDEHPLCTLSREEVGLPVVVRASITDPALVHDWQELTQEGAKLVLAAITESAQVLAHALLDRAAQSGQGQWLLHNRSALELFALLQSTDRWPIAVTELARRNPEWSTVQGEVRPFAKLRRKGKQLWFGRDRYPTWFTRARGQGVLDEPTLHLPSSPEGEALGAVFAAGGYELIDVTEPLAKLQARRASADSKLPRLTGDPAHPMLRTNLSEIDVLDGEGELELIPGPDSSIVLFDLEGRMRNVVATLPFPIRAVARFETQSIDETLAADAVSSIGKGAARLLEQLVPRLLELPEFVVESCRSLFFHRLEHARRPPRTLVSAPLFLDTQGQRHSFLEFGRASKVDPWSYTHVDPPYPAQVPARPILRLSLAQAQLLSKWLKPASATAWIRRELLREGRLKAPPRELMALDAATRAQCMVVATLADGPLSGEVGLLRPGATIPTGIELLTGRRPLSVLLTAALWPLVGVLNDDTVEPNYTFTSPKRMVVANELRTRATDAARSALQAALTAPTDALAAAWVEDYVCSAITVTGRVWLPARWPARPSLVVSRVDAPSGAPWVPRVEAMPGLTGVVPIAGHLIVRALSPADGFDTPTETTETVESALAALLRRQAIELVESAGKSASAREAILPYRYDLALSGADSDLSVQAADGRAVTFAALREEITSRGVLWWTDHVTLDVQDLPAVEAGFVLSSTEPVLLGVLQQRTTPGTLRAVHELGPAREAVPGASPRSTRTPRCDDGKRQGGIIRWLRSLGPRSSEPAPSIPARDAPDPLCIELLAALQKQPLLGPVVATVERRAQRRAIRYLPNQRRLLIAAEHPVLARTGDSEEERRDFLAALTAAVACEINRALREVTDATERAVLRELLRRGQS